MTDLWHFAKIFSDDNGSRQREFFHTPVKNTAPLFIVTDHPLVMPAMTGAFCSAQALCPAATDRETR